MFFRKSKKSKKSKNSKNVKKLAKDSKKDYFAIAKFVDCHATALQCLAMTRDISPKGSI